MVVADFQCPLAPWRCCVSSSAISHKITNTIGANALQNTEKKIMGPPNKAPSNSLNLWIPVIGFSARCLKGAVCVAEEWHLKGRRFKSGAPRPSMRLRRITVAPTFAANQRHRLLSGRLPLSDPCVISRVPPCLCNDHLTKRSGGARSTIVTDARGRTGPRTRNERNSASNADQ